MYACINICKCCKRSSALMYICLAEIKTLCTELHSNTNSRQKSELNDFHSLAAQPKLFCAKFFFTATQFVLSRYFLSDCEMESAIREAIQIQRWNQPDLQGCEAFLQLVLALTCGPFFVQRRRFDEDVQPYLLPQSCAEDDEKLNNVCRGPPIALG